jgi:voltage-gated potassium channel
MANLLLRPTVVEFIESSLYDPSIELVLEELHLPDEGPWVGTTLLSSRIRKDFGLIVVAIKRKEGGLVMNPSPHEVLQGGDILIVLGKRPDLRRVERALGKEAGPQA